MSQLSQNSPSNSDGSLEELRKLLLEAELRDLAQLKKRIESEEQRTMDVALALPNAVRHHAKAPEDLARIGDSFCEPVEEALKVSIARDKDTVAKLLFPVMGPAIRAAVTDMFRNLNESLNNTIQTATSPSTIKWRLEAALTGKDYSELVLLRTLSYQVEEVYLIQRESGLLLGHVAEGLATESDEHDPELVSGMFVAIQNFARESFQSEDEIKQDLGRVSIGDTDVLIESGPSAVLAVCVEGTPPPMLHRELKRVIEEIHERFGGVMDDFSGDEDEVREIRPLLHQLLLSNAGVEKKDENSVAWGPRIVFGLVGAAVLALVATWIQSTFRWNNLDRALSEAPGIEVLRSDRGLLGGEVRILRDPLAELIEPIAERAGFAPGAIAFKETPIQSSEKRFAGPREAAWKLQLANVEEEIHLELKKQRERDAALLEDVLRQHFGTVSGLDLEVSDGRLALAGVIADPDYSEIMGKASALVSVTDVDTSGLVNGSPAEIDRLKDQIAALHVPFASGGTTLAPDGERNLAHLENAAVKLNEQLQASGRSEKISVWAWPLSGSSSKTKDIANKRLEIVRQRLTAAGLEPAKVEAGGIAGLRPNGKRGVYLKVESE